jgi:hypothetical protein
MVWPAPTAMASHLLFEASTCVELLAGSTLIVSVL